jgi:hypothetical protein
MTRFASRSEVVIPGGPEGPDPETMNTCFPNIVGRPVFTATGLAGAARAPHLRKQMQRIG